MKVSLCITTYNEEKHIGKLLDSIVEQTTPPDEIIIVDGGSSDKTIAIIEAYKKKEPFLQKHLKFLSIPNATRPKGRNLSIEKATHDVIAITDAGCVLDKDWLQEIASPFANEKIEVVSGYYAGRPRNIFEKSLVPYVLVMPDRVNASSFLPSTRSMAMKKSVWRRMGGFPQEYRWNEDYVFAKKLKKEHVVMEFAPKAIAYWIPRETLASGWYMFYSFAKGDVQAGIFRPKAMLLVIRILVGIALLIYAFMAQSFIVWVITGGLIFLYLLWAVLKNYRYVNNLQAIIFLPLWQITADSAVSIGTIVGFFNRK